jgi:hypothetical protein
VTGNSADAVAQDHWLKAKETSAGVMANIALLTFHRRH